MNVVQRVGNNSEQRASGKAALLSGAQVRSFTMIGILLLVWIVFQFLTSGLFLSPRNLTNLSGQVAITAILAAGIVMVMVPAYIDLSIGATVSFCAVIAAMSSSKFGFSVPSVIAITMLAGLVMGLWHGVWVAILRVPAFIVTLASLLAVRGLALVVTSSETMSPQADLLVISDTTIPAIPTAILLFVLWIGLVYVQLREYRAQTGAGVQASALSVVGLPAIFTGVLVVATIAIAGSYRGMPLPVVLLLCVMIVVGGLLRLSAFGRRLYAIGGNRQAAALAGINIMRNTLVVFIGMGLLYGLAGLVLVSRLASAPPNAGNGMELNVIAAAVIGGTSLLGGRGTVSGAVIGAVLMESLNNGMSLMNLSSAYQSIAVGLVLLVAVYADIRGRGVKLLGE
ncbi:sugar ABC transporter permease [Rhizobium lusitanum]|uniref:Xylose transport system permease protein XylH n=1 Tax=Rhizobium lusitanum TaxID=293958 RepID=A0A6L9U9C7_9HYPH|nr:sugar ABC transporter permease [Rhizobium lusitanum]NEI72575.1 sugar ABC transporter permease [Rhizobium lusitanum]